MSKINSKHTTSKCIVVQFICAALIILSYYTTPYLNIAAGLIGFLYIISDISWEERFSLFVFLLPFSSVFKFADGQTSIYMAMRIAIIISVLIYDSKKFNVASMYLMIITTLIYNICVSISNEPGFVVRAINIVLWLVISFCMQSEIGENNILPVSRSLVNGLILSCFVGMNLDSIPGMKEVILVNSVYISPDLIETRFAGLFNDPNFFTVLVCVSLWVSYMEFVKGNIKVSEFTIRTLIISFFGAITYSKSCIFVVAVFWLYVLLSHNKIKILAKFFLGIILGVALFYFLIINTEWIEIMRARLGDGSRDLNTVTTGRTKIWAAYIKYLYSSGTWVWGNGLNPLMPLGRASHSVIVECVYCIGVVGSFLMYRFIKVTYLQIPDGYKKIGLNKNGVFFLSMILLTMVFLEALHQELYYYAITICFIYMKKLQRN